MATLVCFHAHPDDEAIATSGAMAKARSAGHRIVLVVATRGENGEVVPDVLVDGEQLGLRRVAETFASAEAIGCDRVEFLGYVDSGMMGEPENDAPYSFWGADPDQAAARLATILREEGRHGPVVLTVYDHHGGYGHPDHIQVHRVGYRAADMAGDVRVFESTINRDAVMQGLAEFADSVPEIEAPDIDADFGEPEANLTHAIDVSGYLELKRTCMRAHASQIAADSFFLMMPPEIFERAFGTEWFIERDRTRIDGESFGDDLFVEIR